MGVFKCPDSRVAAERCDQCYTAFFKETFDFEGITADIVFTQQVDFVLAFLDGVIAADQVLEYAVVGNVVTC